MGIEQSAERGEYSQEACLVAMRFIQRWDLHARQIDDGRYICIRKPLTFQQIEKHLQGEITLGAYMLNQNSTTRMIVLDADDETTFKGLMRMAQMMMVDRIPSYPETSRRGGHLWMFFGDMVPGSLARQFGRGLLAVHRVIDVEVFPKQDRLAGGPGSLMRLPFGIHRLTGQRYDFLDLGGRTTAHSIDEQIAMIAHPRMVPIGVIKAYAAMAPARIKPMDTRRSALDTNALSERIKSSMSVLEFVSQYVELRPVRGGAAGLCPFHDDKRPSFSVNDRGNYWHCFAGCGGGSVIDFWMKWRKCSYETAKKELPVVIQKILVDQKGS